MPQQVSSSHPPEGTLNLGQHRPSTRRSRRQELRNLPFWPSPLCKSQLVKDGEYFLLKKGTGKTLRVLDPIKTSPFVVTTTIRKEALTGNAPMGAIPPKAVTNRFPPTEENQTPEAPGVVFDPTLGDKGVETPLPIDSSKASISPPVGGRLRSFSRDWQKKKCSSNMLNIITNGLRCSSSLPSPSDWPQPPRFSL